VLGSPLQAAVNQSRCPNQHYVQLFVSFQHRTKFAYGHWYAQFNHIHGHAVRVVGASSPEELFDIFGVVEDDDSLTRHIEPYHWPYQRCQLALSGTSS